MIKNRKKNDFYFRSLRLWFCNQIKFMKYIYKNAELPCNEKEDFNTNDISVDIICRLYLREDTDKEYEKKAMEKDGNNYSPDCFFIELVAGKNEPDGEILTSDWLLYYVKDDGTFIEFGYVNDVPENAWEYFKKEIGIE